MQDPDTTTISRVKPELKVERPKLHKVLLVNDDFTPRAFVVTVLRAEFRLDDGQAQRVMMTAHQRGVCVVAVFIRDVADEKATAATEMAASRAIRCSSQQSLRSRGLHHGTSIDAARDV